MYVELITVRKSCWSRIWLVLSSKVKLKVGAAHCSGRELCLFSHVWGLGTASTGMMHQHTLTSAQGVVTWPLAMLRTRAQPVLRWEAEGRGRLLAESDAPRRQGHVGSSSALHTGNVEWSRDFSRIALSRKSSHHSKRLGQRPATVPSHEISVHLPLFFTASWTVFCMHLQFRDALWHPPVFSF